LLEGIITDQAKSTETTKVGEEIIWDQMLKYERGEYHIDTSIGKISLLCLFLQMVNLNVNVMSKMIRIPILNYSYYKKSPLMILIC